MNKKLMNNEVIVERLDTLIKQNIKDHQGIKDRLDVTNGNVSRLKMWRAVMLGMGTVITGAVIPLVIYIALSFDAQLDETNKAVQQTAERS